MGDLRALVGDPEFLQLPAERQRVLAAQVDPDIGQLDQWGQDRLLTRLAPDPYTFTETRHGLPAGFFKSMRQLESSGGTNLKSPTGVLGPYQITGKTGRAFGLPDDQWMDELAQLSTAGNIMADNLKTAKGDLRTATNLYADPADREWYADRILSRLQSPTGAQPGAAIVAAPSPAPEPTPTDPMLPGQQEAPPMTATTATVATTDDPMAIFKRRQGIEPQSMTQLIANAGSTPPSTLEEDRSRQVTGPANVTTANAIPSLLAALGLPGSMIGSGVESATGSRTAGTVAEVGSNALGGIIGGAKAASNAMTASREGAPLIATLAKEALKEAKSLRRMKIAGTQGPKFLAAIRAAEAAASPADVLKVLSKAPVSVTTAKVGLQQLGESVASVPSAGEALGTIAKGAAKGAGKVALGTAKVAGRTAKYALKAAGPVGALYYLLKPK
jgi:hypothetical protein